LSESEHLLFSSFSLHDFYHAVFSKPFCVMLLVGDHNMAGVTIEVTAAKTWRIVELPAFGPPHSSIRIALVGVVNDPQD
jgi:hypothetical protein